MYYKLCLALASMALLSGCTSFSADKLGGSPGLRVLEQAALPEPTNADYRGTNRAYALGPFDKLRIDVAGMPDVSLPEVQADAGGNIAVPLAGTLPIGGLTTDEVAREIERRLKVAFVRDPKVAVNLRETNSQIVTVEGEVKLPGQFAAAGNMTLLGAIARAGGTGEFARLQEVIVFRTVENQRYAALYNLTAIRRGAYPDPAIFANDVVVVGDSPQRRLFRDLLQVVPLITTPLVIALQN